MSLASDEAPFVFGAYAAHLHSRLQGEQPAPLSAPLEVERAPVICETDEPVTPARVEA